jgi:hypothetical protein
MHEKKDKSFGGIETKYVKELAAVTLTSFALTRATAEVLGEMHRDDSDHGDIQSGWLNGPYQLLQNLERDTSELEAKINADPDFSDKNKQEFFDALIDPIKKGNQRARDIDAYIMNGVIPPDFKD